MIFDENNIEFNVKCQIDENIKIKDIDLVSLLGNLLENALNACVKSDNELKKVEIYITVNNNKLIIICENTCDYDLELIENVPKNKGIGISSILSVCEIYKGKLSYSLKNEICSVCVTLSL